MAITPDGKRAYVVNFLADSITVTDVIKAQVLETIRGVRSNPRNISIMPDSRKAYVAVYGENVVAVIDLKSLEVVKRIPTGVGPDGIAIALGPLELKL